MGVYADDAGTAYVCKQNGRVNEWDIPEHVNFLTFTMLRNVLCSRKENLMQEKQKKSNSTYKKQKK